MERDEGPTTTVGTYRWLSDRNYRQGSVQRHVIIHQTGVSTETYGYVGTCQVLQYNVGSMFYKQPKHRRAPRTPLQPQQDWSNLRPLLQRDRQTDTSQQFSNSGQWSYLSERPPPKTLLIQHCHLVAKSLTHSQEVNTVNHMDLGNVGSRKDLFCTYFIEAKPISLLLRFLNPNKTLP